MKTTIHVLIAVFTLAFVTLCFGDDGKYLEVMQKNIQAVYSAQTIPDLQRAVNAFERIAAAEKSKWEPSYYASFGYVMMANQEKDGNKKDAYLDQALAAIGKSKEVAPAESEVIALEGFVHMIRVSVDPATRGQQYSALAFQSFGKAVNLNPENPRALWMLAEMQYGTAQFFNSPVTEACGTLAKSLEKFGTYRSENPLAPQWGKGMAERLKGKCK